MIKIKHAYLALGGLLAMLPILQAGAATYDLGDGLTPGAYSAGSEAAPAFHAYTEGSFVDEWTFTLGQDSNLSVSLTDVETFSMFSSLNLTDLTIRLENALGDILGQTGEGGSFYVAGLNAGSDYSLIVSGTVAGFLGGQYWAALQVQAVPLPAGAWLFASALAAMAGGWRGKRRKC